MLKPSLPFFPFLFFFFLQQHFLIMQKQQVRMSSAATTAMAIRAHGGTVKTTQNWDWRLCISWGKTQLLLNLSRKCGCAETSLTWDLIDFIQEFALDLLKHVVLVDLRAIVGARRFRCRGGDDSRGGTHGHGGGAGRLGGLHGLWPSEQVELHRQRLGAASLGHKEIRQRGRIRDAKQLQCVREVPRQIFCLHLY